MATSAPVFTTEQSIQQLYLAYFNRPADAGGLAYWEGLVSKGVSLATISSDFAANPEYKATYAHMSNDQIVSTIYHNLFNRAPDAGGLTYWSGHLTVGDISIDNIVNAIAASALQDPAQGPDSIAVESKVAASVAFTQYLNTNVDARIAYSTGQDNGLAQAYLQGVTDAASLTAAEAALPTTTGAAIIAGGQPAPTVLALTTGVDNLVASGIGANNFYGSLDSAVGTPIATFGGADSVTGAGSNNTLILTDAVAADANVLPVGATLTDIQAITLKTAGTAGVAGGVTFDVSGVAGLKTVNVVSASAAGDNIKAAATTDITDTSNGTANQVVTAGGHNVTVTTTGEVDIGYSNLGVVGAAAAAAAGNATVTDAAVAAVNVFAAGVVTVADKGATTVTGGTSIATSAMGAKTYAVQHADTVAAAAAHAVQDAAQAKTVADTAISAGFTTPVTGLNATIAAATSQEDLNTATLAAEQGANPIITQAQRAAIDAAYYNAFNATGGTVAKGVAAALVVESAIAAAAAAVVTADNLVSNAIATTGTAVVAAAAADAVVTADAAVTATAVTATTNTALASVSVVGNYAAAGGGAAVITIADGSATQTTLTSVSLTNASAADLTGNGLVTVSLTDQVNNVAIHNATIGHTETLNLNNVKGATIADGAATTVNLVTTGTASDHFTLTAGAATAVNISGTVGVTLDADTLASTAVVTATVGGNTVSLANTDATHAQSFVGGTTGNNTVTITGAFLESATINGGSGGNNTLELTDNAQFATTGAAKFVGFSTLEVDNGVVVDVSAFTGSTLTSFVANGLVTEIDGIAAATAAIEVTALADTTLTLGITGATTPGQIDTVHLTADSGDGGGSLITLTAPVAAGVEILHLTAVDNVAVTALTGTPALTTLTIDGAGTVDITTGALSVNSNTVINAAANTGGLTLNAGASLTFGLSITGSATASNDITTSTVATLTNTVTGGDAGDTIVNHGLGTIHDGNGNNSITADVANTIVVGNGANTILASNGGDTITAGNGDNAITIVGAAGTGNSTLTVGTGSNIVTYTTTGTSTNVLSVTAGAHTAATGIDTFAVGVAGTTFASKANLVITGAVAGDHLILSGDVAANTLLTTGVAGSSVATTIAGLEALVAVAAHDVAYAVYNGNTYIVESNATAASSATNTTVIELVGVHTIHAGTGLLTVVS